MSLFLGFDVGTQSCKALVVDAARGEVVARASEPLELIGGLGAGHMEQHPARWLAAVEATAKRALANVDASRVAGVGVSGQQHGCVVLDDDGDVVRPAKLWCDTATSAEAAELSVPTGFTASKLLWLKRHEPDAWARVRRVLLPHDYVNLWLTGHASMECGDASGTGWFDPRARRFDDAAMRRIDERLPAMLPALLPAGAFAGELTEAVASRLSLPVGTPVSAGGGDNMMSAIGSGATRAGVVVVSLGTSGTLFGRRATPLEHADDCIADFCSSDGGWLPLLCVMNATGVTQEVQQSSGLSLDALTAAARAVQPGCDGLLWLPYLNGERVPDLPQATGTLLGMTPGSLAPARLFRAALEGTSLNIAWGAERLRASGAALESLHVVGGAARNELWRAILAAALDCPLTLMEEPESAALGAALHALWTVRRSEDAGVSCDEVARPYHRASAAVTEPDPALVASYATLLERFRSAVQTLYES